MTRFSTFKLLLIWKFDTDFLTRFPPLCHAWRWSWWGLFRSLGWRCQNWAQSWGRSSKLGRIKVGKLLDRSERFRKLFDFIMDLLQFLSGTGKKEQKFFLISKEIHITNYITHKLLALKLPPKKWRNYLMFGSLIICFGQ